MKSYLIVASGGSGTRMGTNIPKQFLPLGGKAILQLSIEKFLRAVPDIKVVTVLPQDHIQSWKQYCIDHNFTCPQTLVCGGITRFHSVKNALERIPLDCLVAVHDAARPLVSRELIRRTFDEAFATGAAAPAVPVVDTLKSLEGTPVDRSKLLAVQTPQVFRSDILKRAYTLPYNTSFTDDASVVEASGVGVSYVEGERYNLKITTPEDLEIARLVVS